MKTLLLITVLFFCSMILQEEGLAGEKSEAIYNVYVESYSNPRTFDVYIARNRKIFTADFHACSDMLLQRHSASAKEHAEQCRAYTNEQLQQKCLANNLAAQFGLWLLSLKATLNGTPWCETLTGSSSCRAMQNDDIINLYDELFPGLGEQIAKAAEPINRQYLTCD